MSKANRCLRTKNTKPTGNKPIHKQYKKGWKKTVTTIKATIPTSIKISCPNCGSTDLIEQPKKNKCLNCNACFKHPKVEVVKNDK